jgi:valyl-tRNA synthetase
MSKTPPDSLLPTDRWLLSRLARTIAYATAELENGEYSTARAEIERFFWSDLCDNYLELAKTRLYREAGPQQEAAQWTLYHALLSVLKMLAPYMPYITEEIYQSLFRKWELAPSIHTSAWPKEHPEWIDADAEETGKTLLELLRQVRRYKAERGLSVGADIETLYIRAQPAQCAALQAALVDLRSATRAQSVVLEDQRPESRQTLLSSDALLLEI